MKFFQRVPPRACVVVGSEGGTGSRRGRVVQQGRILGCFPIIKSILQCRGSWILHKRGVVAHGRQWIGSGLATTVFMCRPREHRVPLGSVSEHEVLRELGGGARTSQHQSWCHSGPSAKGREGRDLDSRCRRLGRWKHVCSDCAGCAGWAILIRVIAAFHGCVE
jgi:hypothetical protein